jgi:hypothetical protein
MWRLMWLIGVGCGLWLSSVLRAQEELPPPPPPKPGLFKQEADVPIPPKPGIDQQSADLPIPPKPLPIPPKPKVINQGAIGEKIVEEGVEEIEKPLATYLYNNTNEFFKILERLYGFHNYVPGFGHTAAVAVLISCFPGSNSDDVADLMDRYVRMLPEGKKDNFRVRMVNDHLRQARGDRKRSGQLAMLAAILACKTGNQEAAEVIVRLENAYSELWTLTEKVRGVTPSDYFYNLITAAQLMTY